MLGFPLHLGIAMAQNRSKRSQYEFVIFQNEDVVENFNLQAKKPEKLHQSSQSSILGGVVIIQIKSNQEPLRSEGMVTMVMFFPNWSQV